MRNDPATTSVDNIWPDEKNLVPKPVEFLPNQVYLKTYDVVLQEEDLKELIRKILKARIVKYKEEIKTIIQEQRNDNTRREELEAERELVAKEIARTQWKLKFLDKKIDFQTNYFDNRLMMARQVPISNFVQFNTGNFAKSIWNPNERTPSMKYYPNKNKVWCFSTNTGGDVVDVIMVLRNIGFREAIAFLLND